MASAADLILPCLKRQGLVEAVQKEGLSFVIKPEVSVKPHPGQIGGVVWGGFGVVLGVNKKGRAGTLPFIHLRMGFGEDTLLHEMGHFLSWRLFRKTGRHVLGLFTHEEQEEMRWWLLYTKGWPLDSWTDTSPYFFGKVTRGDDEIVAEMFAIYLCDGNFPKLLAEKLAFMVKLLKEA